jgi:hypothetical protein
MSSVLVGWAVIDRRMSGVLTLNLWPRYWISQLLEQRKSMASRRRTYTALQLLTIATDTRLEDRQSREQGWSG